MILVLGVFFWTHYTALSGDITIVGHRRVVISGGRALEGVNSSGLINDYLPQGDIAQSVTDVFDSQILPKFLNEAKKFKNASCKKKFDVSFLKVHKAGSTTVMNIFLRFAIEHNLNIVLPKRAEGFGFNYLGYGTTVHKDRIVPLPANESYNILCNHVVYNKEAFRSILPADTMYIGILREPTSHFVSAASYYGFYRQLRKQFNLGDASAISAYLKQPKSYKIPNGYVNNRMSFDFGVPKYQFYNERFVTDYIQELDRDYSLVMMMERFPESLVLMRRVLCWDTKDILYVPLNARKSGPEFQLTEENKINLQAYNSADFKLYAHFKAKFDMIVEGLGDEFRDEVKSFVRIQESVKTFCIQLDNKEGKEDAIMNVPATRWGGGFYVSFQDCRLMLESELPMMKRLITQAWEKYNSIVQGGNSS